jgi:hypothetical protein
MVAFSLSSDPWEVDMLVECNELTKNFNNRQLRIAAIEGYCHPHNSLTGKDNSFLNSLFRPILNTIQMIDSDTSLVKKVNLEHLTNWKDKYLDDKLCAKTWSYNLNAEIARIKDKNMAGTVRRVLRGTFGFFKNIMRSAEGVLTPVASKTTRETTKTKDGKISETDNNENHLTLKSEGATEALSSIADSIDSATLNLGASCNINKVDVVLQAILGDLHVIKEEKDKNKIGDKEIADFTGSCSRLMNDIAKDLKYIYTLRGIWI